MCVYGCISFLLFLSAMSVERWAGHANLQFAGVTTKLFFSYLGISTVAEA